jgi:PadR family transcriptional regulator, regulatory protein PadR
MTRMKQKLFKGLLSLHILHLACEGELYGQWKSAGTLYQMLHALERRGYLKSREERSGRTLRCRQGLGSLPATNR